MNTRKTLLTLLRENLFFRPLALILALHLVPPDLGPWNLNLAQPAHAQSSGGQAATIAQLPATCFQNGGSYIIQLLCNDGTLGMTNSQIQTMAQQWENDSIVQFLQLYQLPSTPSDVQFVYTYGRTNLRSQIRAYMEMRLASILYALDNGGSTTQNEQQFANWFTHMVWRHEKNLWSSALSNFQSWQANRCTWKVDTDLERQFGFHYVPCVGSVVADTAPTYAYFYYAARKGEYDQLLANLQASTGYLASTSGGSESPNAVKASTMRPRTSAGSSSSQPPSNGESLLGITGTDIVAIAASVGAVVGLGAVISATLRLVPSLWSKIAPYATNPFRAVAKTPTDNPSDTEDQAVKQANSDIDEDAATDTNPGDTAALDAEAGGAETVAEDTSVDGGVLSSELSVGGEISADLAPTVVGVVIAVAVLLVVMAVTFLVEEAEAQTGELEQLETENNGVQASAPDLWPKLQDVNGEGAYKMQVAWIEATYPDVPSTTPLPTPQGSQGTLVVSPYPANGSSTNGSMTFLDWNGNTKTAALYGNYWEISGSITVDTTTVSYTDISPTLRYTDNNGNQMMVSRFGNNFIVTEGGPAPTDVICPAGPNTGVSNVSNTSSCLSYVAPTFNFQNNSGNFTAQIGIPPVINNSISPTFFNTQEAVSSPITATGVPTPTISLANFANLPTGMGFSAANILCCQYPSAPTPPLLAGNYVVNVTASNAAGSVTQAINVTVINSTDPVGIQLVSQPPSTATTGQLMSWTYKATGQGPIQFFTSATPPNGITFTDNGDGTATFSGVPTGFYSNESPGQYGYFLYASNNGFGFLNSGNSGFPNASSYNLLNNPSPFFSQLPTPPAAQLSAPPVLNFPDGQTTSISVTSTGGTTPVSFSMACGGLPSWATFTDNGDGSATFTGSPARGAFDQNAIHVLVNTLGLPPDSSSCSSPNTSLNANPVPQILSSNTATFALNQPGSFTIVSSLSNGQFIPTSPLPPGLSLVSNGDGTATLSGTPTGIGRDYKFEYVLEGTFSIPNFLTGGTPVPVVYTAPSLIIQVTQPPSFSVPPVIYFMAGEPNLYPFVTAGYPAFAGTNIQLASGLPPDLYFTNVTPLTTAPGAGVLQGTPPLVLGGQSFPLVFLVTNPGPLTTLFGLPPIVIPVSGTLQIVLAGDVNHDGVVNCEDVQTVLAALNSTVGQPNYNYYADVNGDGVVNVLDLAFVTAHLPSGTTCPR